VSERRRSLAWVLGTLGVVFAFVGLSGAFLAAEVPSVSALPISARVESTVHVGCDTMPPVPISFPWNESRQVQDYYDAPCDRTYRAGETIRVYIASNDPANIGPSARWTTHPEEHDPFAPFGPNGIAPMLVTLGAMAVLAGLVFIVTGVRLLRTTGSGQTP
jgi:hypothetical protein